MNIYINRLSLHILSLLQLATLIVMYGCHAVGQNKGPGDRAFPKFDSIQVFPKSKEYSYKVFRDQKEEVETHETGLEQQPKTSFVRFVFVNDSVNTISTMNQSKCNAFMNGDSLKINIGTSDGLTGYSVTVTCVKNAFTSRIYRFFDSDPFYSNRLRIATQSQALTLDKLHYTVGDSVFGTIYTRQIDNEGLKSYATGIFRTKVVVKQNQ